MDFALEIHTRFDNLVSVIIPCYQQGCFLPEAVRSLQAQTHPNWEAIIVNDGSTDETEAIARALCAADPRVRYVSKLNGGLSSARNVGLSFAKGEWVQFLDADDCLDSRKFEEQTGVMRSQPDIDLVYGNARYFPDGAFGQFSRGPYANQPDQNWIAEAWADPRPMLRKLTDRNIFPVCTPLLRHSVINLVGPFNEKFAALEDWEYWIRCSMAGVRFQFLEAKDTDAFIRTHGASMTQETERIRMAGYLLRMFCHERLPPSEARDVNLARLLLASSSLKHANRAVRYEVMSTACLSLRERFLVGTSKLCDPGGPLNAIAHGLGQCFPWRMRHWLTTLGLSFVNS
jgi:glycosyltransferase involved in cell wall biosynthesis